MHASTPLPSTRLPLPILLSLSLLSQPLLSPTLPSHPSSQLHTLRSTLLPSPTQPSHISYPSLAPPPLRCPIIPLASSAIPCPILHSPRQLSLRLPTLPSTPLPYAILPSHFMYSLSPSTLSSHQFPTLPHPTPSLPHYLTLPLPSSPPSQHSLPSPYPLTWNTLICHLPSPTLPSPPLSPLL